MHVRREALLCRVEVRDLRRGPRRSGACLHGVGGGSSIIWVVSPPEQPSPSYGELAVLVVGLTSQLERAHARIAELEARLGRDSTNSSQPPSADSIAAKAQRRADRSSRERSADRKPGGQPGRTGSGLAPSVAPDRTGVGPAADRGGEGALPAAAVAAVVAYGANVKRRGDRADLRGQCPHRADRAPDGRAVVRPGVHRVSSPAPWRGSPSACRWLAKGFTVQARRAPDVAPACSTSRCRPLSAAPRGPRRSAGSRARVAGPPSRSPHPEARRACRRTPR